MASPLNPLHDTAFELKPAPGMRRSEAEIIAGRIASARYWRRRRTLLRLRARLFGRLFVRLLGRRKDARRRRATGCPVASPAPRRGAV